jgi:hypothetical protein
MKFSKWLSFATIAGAALIVLSAKPAKSFLSQYSGASGTAVRSKWDFSAFPVEWSLNPAAPNVHGSAKPTDVIVAAFNTWLAAPNASISVRRAADTTLGKASFDGVNMVCFTCSGDFTGAEGVLAMTLTTTADGSGSDNKHGGTSTFAGQIVDSDIIFNPATTFSTDGSSSYDLQTIATHEIGHFLGLDHSAVVKAVMFPYAPPKETALSYDDVAAISALYPKTNPDVATGTISGRITMKDGSAVFGAHVFAESKSANQSFSSGIRKTPVGTLTAPDGSYSITGLPADQYTVAVEPLDGPVTNGDVAAYAPAFRQTSVATNFTTKLH